MKAGKMDGMAAQTARGSRTGPGVGAAAASDWTRQSLHERTRVRTDDERIGTGVEPGAPVSGTRTKKRAETGRREM